nr:hypothetical protein [Tanacetum cinerariifolium]
MCTYMKNMEGFKQKNFKGKSFDDIKKMFDKVYKSVNTFVDMNTENVEKSLKKTQAEVTKGSSKRAEQELEQESAKKQKLAKQEQAKVADDDTAELKRCLEIVFEDDDDVAIEAKPISSKSPTIGRIVGFKGLHGVNTAQVKMDDPNITMEEYTRLEEEKARRRGKVYNRETATFVFEKNSFSYKIISANDLKTDSKNDNDKVNMLLFSSPDSVNSIDDLDFFKDFKNEFPAIVYNDALTSKSDFSVKPISCPQHIDGFNLKDETSLSECDEKEQNVLYFNYLFPFNIIYPDDSKLDKDNDDLKIDIEHSSGDLSVIPLPN